MAIAVIANFSGIYRQNGDRFFPGVNAKAIKNYRPFLATKIYRQFWPEIWAIEYYRKMKMFSFYDSFLSRDSFK